MMIRRVILNLILIIVLISTASGITSITNKWTGTDSNDWCEPNNWDLGREPNFVKDGVYAGDYVWINYVPIRPEGCTIYCDVNEVYAVYVSREASAYNSSVTAILNLKEGSLKTSGWELKLGAGTFGYYLTYPDQPYSIVNMYEGFTLDINSPGGITIGDYYDAEFNMYGGVYNHNSGGFRVSNSAYNSGLGYGAGTLNLYGGQIYMNVWSASLNRADIRDFTPDSKINISEGVMAIIGDNVSFLQGYESDGRIEAIGDRYVLIEYDPNEGDMGTTYLRAELKTRAYHPIPSNTAKEVSHVNTVLSWSPAIGAVSHKVYFGDSASNLGLIAEINEPNRSVPLSTLEYGQQYFWRVDEVNSIAGITEGYPWSFTVSDGVVIDLFEDYNDGTNPITTRWSSLGSGSISLEVLKLFSTVYQDDQSLKLQYNHNNSYSEAVYTYNGTSDWTANNVKSLGFAVHGVLGNGEDILYVAIEDSDGPLSNVVTYSSDPCDIDQTQYSPWLIFNVDITAFGTSVDLTQIKKIRIGIGDRVGSTSTASGQVHIDSIKLYPVRCLSDLVATDLTGDCFIDFEDFAEFALVYMQTSSPVAPYKSPILRYDFEDTADPTVAVDVVGIYDGNIVDVDGINSNGNYEAKSSRNSYLFKGLFGDIGISIPLEAFAGFQDQITISLWAYGDPLQLPRHTYAFKFALADDNILFSSLPSSPGHIYNLMGEGSDYVIYHPITAFTQGSWVHWAFVRDFSTGEIIVYRDGIEVVSKSDATIASSVFSTIDYAWVGSRELTSDVSKPDTPYCGWIDDFEVYDYALSQQEIIYLANQSFDADLDEDFDSNNQVDSNDMSDLVDDWLEQILWP